MKRIAIPITDGKLSEYFGQCNQYKIVEIKKNRLISHVAQAPKEVEITSMPLWISNQGITDVVTYKIDGRIIDLFTNFKINLYIGISCKLPDEIIQSYLNGKLKSDEKIIDEINKNRYDR